MAENKNEIGIAFSGGIYVCMDKDAVPPTSANPNVAAGKFPTGTFVVGYTAEEGFTLTPSTDTQEVKAWPRGDVVKNSNSGGKVEGTFDAYQKNEKNDTLWFGAVKNADGGYVLDANNLGPGFQLYARAIDTQNKTQELYVIPQCELTARGEIALNHTTVSALKFTVAGRWDEVLQGQMVRYTAPWSASDESPLEPLAP